MIFDPVPKVHKQHKRLQSTTMMAPEIWKLKETLELNLLAGSWLVYSIFSYFDMQQKYTQHK